LQHSIKGRTINMRDVRKTGGNFKRFGVGIILSVLLLLTVATGWAAPTVTDMQPPEGSTQPVSTTVTATFSEAMNPATITSGSFTVSRVAGIKAIAAGGNHTMALKGDGTVATWGDLSATVPAGLTGVTAIDTGAIDTGVSHTVALKDDGTLVAWGNNDYGQATVPPGLSGVVAVAVGGLHTVALKNDGTVVAWGSNYDINDNWVGQATVPANLSGVVAIAAGESTTIVLKSDGTVIAWGSNYYGETSVPEGLAGVVAIAAGKYHAVALKNDGTLVGWGSNFYSETSGPADVTGVIAIDAGSYYTVALKNDGTVAAWGWGYNDLGQSTVPTGLSGVTAIATGASHTVALKDDGTVVAWGVDNSYGQCTVPATGLAGVKAIAGGAMTTTALKNDGTVVAWGYNVFGKSTVPEGLSGVTAIAEGYAVKNDGTVVAWGANNHGTVPPDLSCVVAIAVGGGHTVALKCDGTVVAWGNNRYGQTTVPAGLTGVTAIAAGMLHTVALKADGTVVAWGYNYNGQSTVPSGLTGVVAIAAGQENTVVLKADGTVDGWGNNNFPAGLNGVTAIAAGDWHVVALKNNGTVVAWGPWDSWGETVVPTGLTGVTAIAAGSTHVVALKSDGTVVGWGNDGYGQSTAPTSPFESPVAGTVAYDEVTNTATFTPSAPLEPASTYLATVNTGARNAVGDHLVADGRSSFTTEKISATITLTDLNPTYDGTAKAVTATTDPAGLNVVITYDGNSAVPTNAGSYTVVATINDPRYQGNASGILVIDKATAQIDFEGLSQTYDGIAKIVTATTTPAGLNVNLTYDPSATDAGSYEVSGIINDINYQGSKTGTLEVAKASATVTLGSLNQTYDGYPREVTATTTPAGLTVDITYDGNPTAPTNAGSYAVVVTITEANYEGSTSGTLNIAKATAVVTLSNLNQVYNGTAKAVTATTIPAGLTVDITYDGNTPAPSNAGSYAVVATINEDNYEGSATGTLVIAKATAVVTLSDLNQTYSGSPKLVTATTIPAGLTVDSTYDGNVTAPTNAGSYAVIAIVNDANYEGSVSSTLVIAKADQTINFITPAINPASIVKKSTIILNATADSGLLVTFSFTGPGTLTGSSLYLSNPGTVVVTASQPGDSNHNAATVTTTINVTAN
jgi:alpha-tubulin suppressor-like RCC1 family protein